MSEPSLFETPAEFRAACDQARARGARVALVPTMGALHHGHLALVREARRAAEEATAARPFVAVSVFVNPTQFGPHEDFSRYPRDLEGDTRKLASVGADAVFAPSAPRAMYPEGEETRVRVGPLASHLCGPFRPGHFEGVATVVAKLFALAGPSLAVFGRKDYQQLAILRRVAIDLFFPVQIVGYPIVRERDGLAMSSRNAYLSPEERLRARALSRGLSRAWDAFETGERDATRLEQLAHAEVASATPDIDYVSVADPHSLAPFPAGGRVPAAALVAIACRLGKTRLLDNVVLGEDPRPSPHADDGPAPIV